MIRVAVFLLGPLKTNTYVLFDEHTRDAIIVDPGDVSVDLVNFVVNYGLKVRGVLATHGHFDHVLGVDYYRARFGSEFYINALDIEILRENERMGFIQKSPMPDEVFEGDIELSLGSLKLRLFHTPGHTPGSTCLYSSEIRALFTGDTLFQGSVGRTDLPGGSTRDLYDSLRKLYRLLERDLDTAIYPGHGPTTTLRQELNRNAFVKRAVGSKR